MIIKKEGTHSDWFEKKDKVSKKSKKDSKQSASGIQISPIDEKLGIVFKLCHYARCCWVVKIGGFEYNTALIKLNILFNHSVGPYIS